MKTIDVVNTYNTLKGVKMTMLSEETLVSMWKNLKVMRPITEEYEKDVKAAKDSLEDDEYKKMSERLRVAVEREQKVKNGEYTLTSEEEQDVRELNTWFANYQAKGEKYFKDIAEAEVEVEISKLPEDEILKAFKENGKTFEDMENIMWILK